MGLESAPFINGLVSTNPIGASDPKSQGDDHIRLLKSAILATFPNITGAVTPTHTVLNAVQDAANLTSGVLANARVQASNVTQHQAALAIACSQLTGNMPDARIIASNVTQHQAALALGASQITSGTLAVARGGTGQTTAAAASQALVLSGWTIQSDPGGTPSGSAGAVFAYY